MNSRKTFDSIKKIEMESAPKPIDIGRFLDNPRKIVERVWENYVRSDWGINSLFSKRR